MARALAKAMALPRRLPLGWQRQSLHFPRTRAKKGQRADAGVSNKITTAPQAEGHCLDISALAKFQIAALFGQLGAAARTEPLALGIAAASPPNRAASSDWNRPHISQLCQMRLHSRHPDATMAHAA